MKIGLVQFQSSSDLENNLERMGEMTKTLKNQGADVVVFPEMAYLTGNSSVWSSKVNQYQNILMKLQEVAATYKVFLLPGSLREPSKEKGKFYNSLSVINPYGQVVATYRKIFLFKANLPDRNYDEAKYCSAGTEIVVTPEPCHFGLSICYDLRFPELFRKLKTKGAKIIFLPSAFTVPTGQAHWKTLVTARAIENQVFMVAPGQTGINGEGNETYGHSLVVAPWGEVLCEMGSGEGWQTVNIDISQIDQAKARVDAEASRRNDLFG